MGDAHLRATFPKVGLNLDHAAGIPGDHELCPRRQDGVHLVAADLRGEIAVHQVVDARGSAAGFRSPRPA